MYYTACVHKVDLFKLCTNKTIQCKHFKNHTYTFEHLTINLFYYDYSNKFIRSKPAKLYTIFLKYTSYDF